jgi:signal transduction histidine kinase
MTQKRDPSENTVLVLAPVGRDADLIRELLTSAGLSSRSVPDLRSLASLLSTEIYAAVIVAEEAIRAVELPAMRQALDSQPAWSDVPIILLLSSQSAGRSSRGKTLIDLFAPSGNISLMERPFHAMTLVSSVQVAVRARRRQYQMRDLVEELRASLQQRELFMSAASHELKTPLTSLMLHTRMSLRAAGASNSPFADERVLKTLRHTDRQLSRLTQLIDTMLDVTRIEVGKFALTLEPTDLSSLVRDVTEMYLPQFKDGACGLSLPPEPIVGSWDRHRLEQVFTNLITNAIKYGGGKPVEIRVALAGETAVVEIEDHGDGIPPEDQARIFDRFERANTNGSVSGLGLGLYIVRNIVEFHGGRISVRSEPGRGSTFRVELPLKVSAHVSSTPIATRAGPPAAEIAPESSSASAGL